MRKTFFSVHRIVHENWSSFFTVQHTWSFDIILCNPIEFLFNVKQWDIIKQLSIFRQLHSKIDWLKQQTISLIIFQRNTLKRIIRQMLASLLKEYLINHVHCYYPRKYEKFHDEIFRDGHRGYSLVSRNLNPIWRNIRCFDNI